MCGLPYVLASPFLAERVLSLRKPPSAPLTLWASVGVRSLLLRGPMFDVLEPRRLLSVTTFFSGGQLTVTGDSNANHVSITKDSSGTNLKVRDGSTLIRTIASSQVQRIYVGLNAGADTLDTSSSITQRMTIS